MKTRLFWRDTVWVALGVACAVLASTAAASPPPQAPWDNPTQPLSWFYVNDFNEGRGASQGGVIDPGAFVGYEAQWSQFLGNAWTGVPMSPENTGITYFINPFWNAVPAVRYQWFFFDWDFGGDEGYQAGGVGASLYDQDPSRALLASHMVRTKNHVSGWLLVEGQTNLPGILLSQSFAYPPYPGTVYIDNLRLGSVWADTLPPNPVPEPSGLLALMSGLPMAGYLLRRKRS